MSVLQSLRAPWSIQIAVAHRANSPFDQLARSGSHHSMSPHAASHWASHHAGATAARRNEELAPAARPHPTGKILVMHSRFAGFDFRRRGREHEWQPRSSPGERHSFEPSSCEIFSRVAMEILPSNSVAPLRGWP